MTSPLRMRAPRRCHRIFAVFILAYLVLMQLNVFRFVSQEYARTIFESWQQPTTSLVRSTEPQERQQVPQKQQQQQQQGRSGVAIFGAAGFVGSKLMQDLQGQGHEVKGYDIDPSLPNLDIDQLSSHNVKQQDLVAFRHVIFLGGCTGPSSCEKLSAEEVYKENVESVNHLASLLENDQQLIVASTATIVTGNGYLAQEESSPVQEKSLDVYSASMHQRETLLQELSNKSDGPEMVALRFGTVVGVSPGQRTDSVIPGLFRDAYSTGVLHVHHCETVHSFLWLSDLSRAMGKLLQDFEPSRPNGFRVFHLGSFVASVEKIANSIASRTGARVDAIDHREHGTDDIAGFSLSTSKFEKEFNFAFLGNITVALDEMDAQVPDSITPKGAHAPSPMTIGLGPQESRPCPVCGSHHVHQVLDLHEQPFPHDFKDTAEEALECPKHPLRLVRCSVCNHMYLSHAVNHGEPSTSPMRLGTSLTLQSDIKWLEQKLMTGAAEGPSRGNFLFITSTDDSQLNYFQKFGWKIFGVDPAAALSPDLEFPELPPPKELHAVIVENVLDRVTNPVEFLKKCRKVMGRETELFVQISHCHVHERGQFDVVTHEHVSFFTGHSFQKVAELADLWIVDFEMRGTSCLVTFVRTEDHKGKRSMGLQQRLHTDVQEGIASDFFYTKFEARAQFIGNWMALQLQQLANEGYTIGASGATANGMVLLNFMMSQDAADFNIDFVLDDAPFKQNKFCPGTSIPIKPTPYLKDLESDKPLAILVLAWSHWPEIAQRLRDAMIGVRAEFLVLVPFPEARIMRVVSKPRKIRQIVSTKAKKGKYSVEGMGIISDKTVEGTEIVVSLPYYPTAIPNPLRDPSRRRLLMVTHFSNEEFLLPYFIRQHASVFDHAVLMDYESTDNSTTIISNTAPDTWSVEPSYTGSVFNFNASDVQIMDIENRNLNDWALSLTLTEFVVYPNLRTYLASIPLEGNKSRAFRIHSVRMCGDDTLPLRRLASLPEQRSEYIMLGENDSLYNRIIHVNTGLTHNYTLGRHYFRGPPIRQVPLPGGFLMKFKYTPWPQVVDRMLGVQKNVPKGYFENGLGDHHKLEGAEQLNQLRDKDLNSTKRYDFCRGQDLAFPIRGKLDNMFRTQSPMSLFNAYHGATGRICSPPRPRTAVSAWRDD